MDRTILSDSLRTSAVIASVIIGSALLPPVASAQEEGHWPSNEEAHPGQIVYSRDVPYGTATRRLSQGEASTVAPDQSPLIIDTLGLGLEPLSNAEQASVTAPLMRSMGSVETVLVSNSPLVGPQSLLSDFTRAENRSTASSAGIIGESLQAIDGALSVLRSVSDGSR